jgi:uncharacterized DUF497 family protein
MKITYDPAKREKTLRDRGLDFDDASEVFAGPSLTNIDDRRDYGEVRMQTYGLLAGRLVLLVWTARDAKRHIISMRKCNVREQKKVAHRLG